MSGTTRNRWHNELLQRCGMVVRCPSSISIRADKPRGQTAERTTMCTAFVEGEFTESINGSSAFSLMAYVTSDPSVGHREIPCIGAITAIKPVVMGAIDMTQGEFQCLLTLISTGALRSCYLVFSKPRWRSALIVSADFSTKPASEYE
jgi:hypothetical protein